MSDRGTDVFPGGRDQRALPELSHRARSAHRVAATVTGVFCAAGLAWVFFTDILLYGITRDRTLIARIETAKGWAFIGLSCLLLYAVTFLSAARLDRVRRLTAAVVESIADGVLLLGHDRTIAYANPAAGRMLGRLREDLIGMTAAEFSRAFRVSYPNGAIVPPDRYISQRAFDEGGPLHYRVTLHPPAGELAASITAAGVRLEVGAPATWVVSVIHDVSGERAAGAYAGPVLRGRRAFAQDTGRGDQGRRAAAGAGDPRAVPARSRRPSSARATGSIGWCRT